MLTYFSKFVKRHEDSCPVVLWSNFISWQKILNAVHKTRVRSIKLQCAIKNIPKSCITET